MASSDEEYHIYRTGNHPQGYGKLKVYQNKTRAYNEADKLDNAYGAVAHTVKRVRKEHEMPNWKQ
jgi:hypothetical protein